MKVFVKIMVSVFVPMIAFAASRQVYTEPIPIYSLHHELRDTVDFRDVMSRNGTKLIVFCAKWSPPSYKEFNLLYSQGIISKLLENDASLIIVADTSPCLDLKSPLIDGDWNECILQDFEIYYDRDFRLLEAISGNRTFPYSLVMNNSDVLVESEGLKEDYSFILDAITKR